MVRQLLLSMTSLFVMTACNHPEPEWIAVGQLASDRVEVAFEAHGRIVSRGPAEGSQVTPDTVLYLLDDEEIKIRLRAARAGINERIAALAELTNGTRPEVLAQARSDRAGARDTAAFRERELNRLSNLLARELIAPSAVDAARSALDEARARVASTEARFDELIAGPRPEAIDRARASLAVAEAEYDQLALQASRHRVHAGVTGRLDQYIFEVGEQAREHQVAAILLIGDQPLASIFVPSAGRASLDVGDPVMVEIEGFDQRFSGRIRWISAEAAFTPYFALTERDRGRLSYRAEVLLDNIDGDRLPDGLPVEVQLSDRSTP